MDGLGAANRPKKKKLAGIKSQMKHMSKEAMRCALLKKKQCSNKAIEIVQSLIEPDVTEEFLISNLFHINQEHFEDVIEERSVVKLCGYPLCKNTLTCVVTKQYHISTKTNKVYDITERKKFCSNTCYKAGVYLKNQLYTSPLWLREHEDVVTYKLLPLVRNDGSCGAEIDLGHHRVSPNDNDKSLLEEGRTESENETSQPSSQPLTDILVEPVLSMLNELNIKTEEYSRSPVPSAEEEKSEVPASIQSGNSAPVSEAVNQSVVTNVTPMSPKNEQNIAGSSVFSPSRKTPTEKAGNQSKNQSLRVKKVKTDAAVDPKQFIIRVEQIVQSWITIDTLCVILGDEKVKELLEMHGIDHQSRSTDPYLFDRYSELCRRLNLVELEETYGSRDAEIPKNPAPDLESLRKQAQELQIKVRSFYQGKTEIELPNEEEDTPDKNPQLPLVDQYAAGAARRRIFLQKLSKSFSDIQVALGLGMFNLTERIKHFSCTLHLTASNILLKPPEWNIVAIILIKLFSIQDEYINVALKQETPSKYLELILMSYTLDSGYLDRLVCWLLDINNIANKQNS